MPLLLCPRGHGEDSPHCVPCHIIPFEVPDCSQSPTSAAEVRDSCTEQFGLHVSGAFQVNSGLVHTTREEFENEVYTAREKCGNATIIGHFG